MSKATVHAKASARRYGGQPDEYLFIHEFIDSSKSILADNRHRFMYHHTAAIGPGGVVERVCGKTFVNSVGREVSVRDVAEDHCREDFGGHIPTLQDWLGSLSLSGWMSGFGRPPSVYRQPEEALTGSND